MDQRIGEVLSALPDDVAQNTVIVFASDHGEYAGAHGIMSGKILTCYEEAFHVPLIVVDPTGRFAGDIDTVRTELTSSVDMLPLLVSLGHNGSRDWMTGDLAASMANATTWCRCCDRPRRRDGPICFSQPMSWSRQSSTSTMRPCISPACGRSRRSWRRIPPGYHRTAEIEPGTMELEFYDYATPEGTAEMVSHPDDPRAGEMRDRLLNDLIPNELREKLPGALGEAQELSKKAFLFVEHQVLDPTSGEPVRDLLRKLGYGREF